MSTRSLIVPRWLVPVDPPGSVLERHAVLVEGSRVASVLPLDKALENHPDVERIALDEHVLIPGFVNAHTHAAMTLLRGLADDLPLMRWLNEHIWPAEQRHVSFEFVADGTAIACAEMLRGGITCFNDMYFFPEAAHAAAQASGMRVALGMIVIEFPTAYASDADDYLQKGLALRDRLRGDSRTSFCLAPHAPYTVSDASFRRIAQLAAELDVPVHVHLHETEDEIAASVAEHGVRPLERLRRLGLLGPGLLAVHAVHLSEDEIGLLGAHGCSIAHCPSSNLKLASGFSPVAALARAGANIALGTDGAASNNRLDLFQEMRQAALLAKAVARDAQALPAHAALRAATLAGAQALGLDARIGSITEGKQADLVAVRMADIELQPCYDPVSHLVYASGREHVSHVWIDGKLQLSGGILTGVDAKVLETRAKLWQNRIRARAAH